MSTQPETGAATTPDAVPIRVRRAIAADMPALGRLGPALIAFHHDLDASRFVAAGSATPELYAAFFDAQHRRPDALVLVAEARGTIVGYAYAVLDGGDAMALRGPAGVVRDLAVDPGHRRRGAGRMLLDVVRTALVALGAPQLVLSAAARNGPARRFFAAQGFRPTMIEMTVELRKGITSRSSSR